MSNYEQVFDSDSDQSNDSYYVTEDDNYLITEGVNPAFILPEVIIQTDEDRFDLLHKCRAKIFRWRNEWKERGIGVLKILRDKMTNKVRIALRQDSTKKVMMNVIIEEDPLCKLKEHNSSEKMIFFIGHDYSDGDCTLEKFVIKFSNSESKSF
jgi:hypothetical protein